MRKLFCLFLFILVATITKSQNLNLQYQNGTQISNFATSSISSDFGKRNYYNSSWHNGVDFGGTLGTFSLLSLEQGIVAQISGTGYKYIIVQGTNGWLGC